MDTRRNTLIIFVVSITFIFVLRLFYIQVIDTQWKEEAASMSERKIVQYPSRGLILDRNQKILVANTPVYDLMVVPEQLEITDTLKLCRLLGISEQRFEESLNQAFKYSRKKASALVKQIPGQDYAPIAEALFAYKGLYGQPRTLRSYPKNVAAHALGYISEVSPNQIKKSDYYSQGDYIGSSGLEYKYEDFLRGVKGAKYVVVDVHNNQKGVYSDGSLDKKSEAGEVLQSTIDADVQAYAEALMKGKKGSVVAIEPETGEILCIVTNPSYDPNLLIGRIRGSNYRKLLQDSLKPLFNRSIMSRYPPGSTFKLFNALVGLQEGVVDSTTKYTCRQGYFYAGRKMGCHAHTSTVGLQYSIQTSCNAFYANVFKSILDHYPTSEEGYKKWVTYAKEFGFGSKLGIDLPNETSGFVPSEEYYNKIYGKGSWNGHTVISLAIGQGEMGVSPLQMANYTAALANRGHYIQPHLIRAVNDSVLSYERHDISIDKKHFETVVTGMRRVVTNGTGRGVDFDAENFPMCGKTGTAQNPHGKDHSIFILFAPKDNPKIAVAVYVENVGFGSTWAAPIASLVAEKFLTDSITRPRKEEKMLNGKLY